MAGGAGGAGGGDRLRFRSLLPRRPGPRRPRREQEAPGAARIHRRRARHGARVSARRSRPPDNMETAPTRAPPPPPPPLLLLALCCSLVPAAGKVGAGDNGRGRSSHFASCGGVGARAGGPRAGGPRAGPLSLPPGPLPGDRARQVRRGRALTCPRLGTPGAHRSAPTGIAMARDRPGLLRTTGKTFREPACGGRPTEPWEVPEVAS